MPAAALCGRPSCLVSEPEAVHRRLQRFLVQFKPQNSGWTEAGARQDKVRWEMRCDKS